MTFSFTNFKIFNYIIIKGFFLKLKVRFKEGFSLKKTQKGLIYKKETSLSWDMLSDIRQNIGLVLSEYSIDQFDIDTIIMIINELLENVCKYTNDKLVFLKIIKKDGNIILIIENSIKDINQQNLDNLKEEIKRVNSYNDLNQLMLDSITRTAQIVPDESKLGLPLIRKLAKGAKIELKNSNTYKPGIAIRIKYNSEVEVI